MNKKGTPMEMVICCRGSPCALLKLSGSSDWGPVKGMGWTKVSTACL